MGGLMSRADGGEISLGLRFRLFAVSRDLTSRDEKVTLTLLGFCQHSRCHSGGWHFENRKVLKAVQCYPIDSYSQGDIPKLGIAETAIPGALIPEV